MKQIVKRGKMQKFKSKLKSLVPILICVLGGCAAMDLLDFQFHIFVVYRPTVMQQFSQWLVLLLVILGCSVVLKFIRFIVVSWKEAKVWHSQHSYRKSIEDKKDTNIL